MTGLGPDSTRISILMAELRENLPGSHRRLMRPPEAFSRTEPTAMSCLRWGGDALAMAAGFRVAVPAVDVRGRGFAGSTFPYD